MVADAPRLPAAMAPGLKLRLLQDYIESFEYNHTGFDFFKVDKTAPYADLVRVADRIVAESLPIKCLEATALALRLTMREPTWARFPLRFGSRIDRRRFWHIVCVVVIGDRFGVLGLSRCPALAYRPAQFATLYDVIGSFLSAYADCGHEVDRIVVGAPFPHDGDRQMAMAGTPTWAKLSLTITCMTSSNLERALASFCRRQLRRQRSSGQRSIKATLQSR